MSFNPNNVPDFEYLVEYCVFHAAESMAETVQEVHDAVFETATDQIEDDGEWEDDGEISIAVHALRAIKDKDFLSYVLMELRRCACPNYFEE